MNLLELKCNNFARFLVILECLTISFTAFTISYVVKHWKIKLNHCQLYLILFFTRAPERSSCFRASPSTWFLFSFSNSSCRSILNRAVSARSRRSALLCKDTRRRVLPCIQSATTGRKKPLAGRQLTRRPWSPFSWKTRQKKSLVTFFWKCENGVVQRR